MGNEHTQIEVRCEHCQTQMTVRPHHVGQRIGCPKCSKQFVVPKPAAKPKDVVSIENSVNEQPEKGKRAPAADFFDGALWTAALLFLAGGVFGAWMTLNDRGSQYSERGDAGGILDHRFATDNAMGATANAVEWIAKQSAPSAFGQAFWFGVALWGLSSLRRIRLAIERLTEVIAPSPEKPSIAYRAGKWFAKKKPD